MNSDLGRNEPSAKSSVTPSHIRAADALIATHIRRTPIVETPSPIAGAPPVSLKLECLQHSGSFKARGAFHNLLTRPAPPAGCATASGGNHGAAVAYAARKLGVKARSLRAGDRHARQDRQDPGLWRRGGDRAARPTPRRSSAATPMSPKAARCAIHPYDAPETIAGAGTVAMEWEDDLRRLAHARARHGPRRGRRRRTDLGRRRLVRRPGQGRRGRAGRLARPSTPRFRPARPSMSRSHRSPPNSLGAKRVGEPHFEIAGDRSARSSWFRTRRSSRRSAGSGARSRSSPNRAAPRPSRRWRAAPIGRSGASASACSSAGQRRSHQLRSSFLERAAPRGDRPAGGAVWILLDSPGFRAELVRLAWICDFLFLGFSWIFSSEL